MDTNHNNTANNHELNLSIYAINTNSIISDYKQFILQKFLDTYCPDLVLISETKLNPNHYVNFSNYNILRTDRPQATQGGGTAILYKNNIHVTQVKCECTQSFKLIETTILKMKLTNDNFLYIISIYVTNSNQSLFKNEIDKLFNALRLSNSKTYYLIAGDFNARNKNWGDQTSNQRGRYLSRWLMDNNVEFKCKLYNPIEPTYEASFLDHCLADSRIKIMNSNNKLPVVLYDSDHNALEIKMSIDLNLEDNQTHSFSYMYKKTNWNKFSKFLNSIHSERVPHTCNLSNDSIDLYLDNINKSILTAIEKIVPTRKPYVTSSRYINRKIESIYKMKSYLISCLYKIKRGTIYASRNEVNNIKEMIKSVNDLIEKEIIKNKSKFWEQKIRDINYKDSCTFFPDINKIFRKKNYFDPDIFEIPKNDLSLVNLLSDIISEDDSNDTHYIIKGPDKVRNSIGKFFQQANGKRQHPEHAKTLLNIVNNNTQKINNKIQNRRINDTTFTTFSATNTAVNPKAIYSDINMYTTYDTVKNKIKSLPNKTSAGPDGIPCLILKYLPPPLLLDITIVFNNLINNSYYPKKWKTAVVCPVLKKSKDKKAVTSYRPISLLPNISKIFESIIKDKIMSHSNANKLLPDQQYGFRSRLSTVHAVTSVVNNVYKHLNNNKYVGAVLIDLEKAFDSVWLEGLLFKFCQKKFPDFLTYLIWDMLNNRNFYIRGTNSEQLFYLDHGVQQGSVTGPVFFIHYFSDLLCLFDINASEDLTGDMFADDLIVKVAGRNPQEVKEKLEKVTNQINRYCTTWHLKVNIPKCESILFRPPVQNLATKNRKGWREFSISIKDIFTLEEIKVPHKDCVKYLGVNLDSLMRFHIHCKIQLNKAKNALMANSKLFHSPFLNITAKIICYMLLIRSIICYAAPVWFNMSASAMEKIRKLERDCLRKCLNLYRTPESEYKKYYSNKILYNLGGIPRIDLFIIKIIREHYRKIKSIDNNSIQESISITPNDLQTMCKKGYIYPAAFLALDKLEIIQAPDNVPELYHVSRNERNKKIIHPKLNNAADCTVKYKYSRTISDADILDKTRFIKGYYWWLQSNIEDDVRRRSRRKT